MKSYLLRLKPLVKKKQTRELQLILKAKTTSHAQAQAKDIRRAFDWGLAQLEYIDGKVPEELVDANSLLFSKLAANEFTHKECWEWTGKYSADGAPCTYCFNERIFIRPLILRYLDIPKDDTHVGLRCDNKRCVNPYHFEYKRHAHAKLSQADIKLMLAYLRQGASMRQVAKAFNVSNSTIYRNLKREHLSTRAADYKQGPNR
jgi:hypothetical protein